MHVYRLAAVPPELLMGDACLLTVGGANALIQKRSLLPTSTCNQSNCSSLAHASNIVMSPYLLQDLPPPPSLPPPPATHTPQFEDPAPGLQLLREGLEVEMMDAAPWLTGPADAALAAAAAAEARLIEEAHAKLMGAGTAQQAAAAAATGPTANGVVVAGEQGTGSGAGNNAAGGSTAAAAAAAGVSGAAEPSDCLVMPYALQQRVTKELKIHKHQVCGCVCVCARGGGDGCVLGGWVEGGGFLGDELSLRSRCIS
jgi:hypothetical protein